MNGQFDLEKIWKLMKELVDGLQLRLYDIEFNPVSQTFRVFIDKESGGVTIADCKKASKIISKELDNSDLVTFSYALEVSSPGIERSLKRHEHYEWAVGKPVELNLGEIKIKGYLRDVTEQSIVVATSSGERSVLLKTIVKGRVMEDLEYGNRR